MELIRAEGPHHVWAIDFQFDQTMDSHRLKFLNVINEFSRVDIAIRFGRNRKAVDIITTIDDQRSKQKILNQLQIDNGCRLIANAI